MSSFVRKNRTMWHSDPKMRSFDYCWADLLHIFHHKMLEIGLQEANTLENTRVVLCRFGASPRPSPFAISSRWCRALSAIKLLELRAWPVLPDDFVYPVHGSPRDQRIAKTFGLSVQCLDETATFDDLMSGSTDRLSKRLQAGLTGCCVCFSRLTTIHAFPFLHSLWEDWAHQSSIGKHGQIKNFTEFFFGK